MTSQFTQSYLNQTPGFDFVAAHFNCENNLYSEANPDGYVNFGSAQNFLQSDTRNEKLESLEVDPADARYQAFTGTEPCRTSVAGLLEYFTANDGSDAVSVDPAHVVLGNGVISLLEALTVALLDDGDKVLIPTPVFPGLINAMSLRVRSGVHLLHTNPDDDFRLTPAMLEAELQQQATVQRIRAVLLCSPGNPIGQVFSQQELVEFLAIAERFECALIVDEVYAGSCLEGVEFFSAIKLQSDNVYVLGGLSKDFGLAGFATGWMHIANDAVRRAVARQAHFYRLPAPLQRMTESILKPNFRGEYLTQHRKALTSCFDTAVAQLRNHKISISPFESGLCLWLDLREYLTSLDEDGEMALYQSLLNEYRVHISPGSGFASAHFGFFRICISQDMRTLREGLVRLANGLAAHDHSAQSTSADCLVAPTAL